MGDQLISALEKIMYKVSLRDPITVVSKEAIRGYKGVPKSVITKMDENIPYVFKCIHS